MSELTNDDIAQMIEDAHAHSYIAKGDKRTVVGTDWLTLVLRELLAARAERDAAVAEAVRAERDRCAKVVDGFHIWRDGRSLADDIRRGE